MENSMENVECQGNDFEYKGSFLLFLIVLLHISYAYFVAPYKVLHLSIVIR